MASLDESEVNAVDLYRRPTDVLAFTCPRCQSTSRHPAQRVARTEVKGRLGGVEVRLDRMETLMQTILDRLPERPQ